MTPAQAQSYFNSISATEQQAVRASGANITDWANASESAGDPRALDFSGVTLGGGGDTFAGRVATGGAPSSSWAGQRKPTPAELRTFAAENKWSEDFRRYDDRQLAAWVSKSWDISANRFKNDAGDVVDKPTESGPLSTAKGWATGESDSGRGGGGGGGRGGGAAAAPMVNPKTGLLESKAPLDPRSAELADLQNVLEEKFMARQGQFGVGAGGVNLPDTFAKPTDGGGIWWGTDKNMFDEATSGARPAAPAVAPTAAPAAPATAPFAPATTPSSQISIPTPSNIQTMVGGPLEEELRRKAMTRATPNNYVGARGAFAGGQYGI